VSKRNAFLAAGLLVLAVSGAAFFLFSDERSPADSRRNTTVVSARSRVDVPPISARGAVPGTAPAVAGVAPTPPPETGRVHGLVIDRKGRPFRGATVSPRVLAENNWKPVAVSATTDDAGLFRFELPPGMYDFLAEAPGHTPRLGNYIGATVVAGADADAGTAVLVPANVLRGTVQGDDGRPVLAKVSLRDYETTSAPDGSFAFSHVPQGLHGIRFEAPGYVEQVLGDVPVADGRESVVSVTLLHPGILEGVVKAESGEGVPATLQVDVHGKKTTDERGRFHVDEISPGEVRVSAWTSDGRSGWTTVTVAGGATVPVEVVVHPLRALAGRVLDAQGRPAPERQVYFEVVLGDRLMFATTVLGRPALAVSDASGRFEVELEESSYEVSVMDSTRTFPERVWHAVTPKEAQPLDLVLPEEGSIAGTLLGPDGMPVSGLDITFYEADGTRTGEATSSSSGEFLLGGLPPGIFWLRASTETACLSRRVELAAGANVSGVELRLAPWSQVRGRLLDPRGQPLADVRVELTKTEGTGGGNSTGTGDDGSFLIPQVDPGSYTFSVGQPELDLVALILGVSHVHLPPVSISVEAGRDVVRDLVVSSDP
jgi:hypothetical protein